MHDADALCNSIWKVMGSIVCQLCISLKYRVYSPSVDMQKSFSGGGIVHSKIGLYFGAEEICVFIGKNCRTLNLLNWTLIMCVI